MIRKLVFLGLILTAAYFMKDLDKTTSSEPSSQSVRHESGKSRRAANDNVARGDFDFYLLALSWSPSFCASSGNQENQQCSTDSNFGFVVHGLWPQNEAGWPEFCSTSTDRVPNDVVENMLDIMPSSGLILHQWRKHGSCTGLSPKAYFDMTRKALQQVKFPEEYQSPSMAQSTQPDYIENRFMAMNTGLKSDMLHVTCRQNKLQEVRICMDKDLNFRPCPNLEYRACHATDVTVPPVN